MERVRKKKIYIKKIGDFGGYAVWYVDGYWIRKNLDRAFTNFAGHRHLVFIPKDEFWIDQESKKKEARYFIDNFIVIERELKNGKSFADAAKIADKIEKRERGKSGIVKRLKKIKSREKVLAEVRKKILFGKYTKNLKIWQVRGDLVRSLFYLDFTEGGHDKVYDFIPENEVWIDDDVYKKEIPYVLIHELCERKLMAKGWKYDPTGQGVFSRKKGKKSAHFAAEKREFWCREHPKRIMGVLKREIKENEKI